MLAADVDVDADGAGDASASFTLTAPATRRFEAITDDNKADAQTKAGEEDAQAVSASYTIVSRREKPVEQQQQQAKESEAEQQQLKTDSDEANQRTRPTELSLAPASESKAQATTTTPATPATTPGTVESPVRLRDKRSLSSSMGGGDDAKSETASPVSVHGDFNARDSLLSLYARGAGGAAAGAAQASAAAAAAAPSTSSSTSAVERRPSWRLMLDAGSKVMHTLSRTQNYLQQQLSSATQLTANRTEPNPKKKRNRNIFFFSTGFNKCA